MHTDICFLALTPKGSRSNDTPAKISTPINNVLIFKYWSPVKENELLGKMLSSVAGSGRLHDETGAKNGVRK